MLVVLALLALFFTDALPTRQPDAATAGGGDT
jgi:hypothetical protein